MDEKPLTENYLQWDKPIRLTLDINFHIDENEDFKLFGLKMPEKMGISAHWELESGKRYTPLIDLEKEICYRKPADYLRSGLRVMQTNGIRLPCGFNVEISSQIPIAKGISSSSALEVAWIQFLAVAAGLVDYPADRICYCRISGLGINRI